MRYAFNTPTTWGFEATAFLYGMHYMFGLSYTDVRKQHVQVDIFTSLAPRKVRAAISALTTLVFFYAGYGLHDHLVNQICHHFRSRSRAELYQLGTSYLPF